MLVGRLGVRRSGATCHWLRTNGVNTNGVTAEVPLFDGFGTTTIIGHFDRLGKKVHPGTFGSTKKVPLSNNAKLAVTPLVPTPLVPLRATAARLLAVLPREGPRCLALSTLSCPVGCAFWAALLV